MQKKPNRLATETSPYLLQHAYNPVDWYPWGDEALQRAQKENKPILISIGYSSCHWCHVMERESFEDPATAAIMNEHFVNIKIDREERPDLDHIYMDAVQAMTGSGGWPLNVFLTPQLQPFYGGTYFPPTALPQRASWTDVLQGISSAFRERRSEVEKQASSLTAHLFQSNNFVPPQLTEKFATRENLQAIRDVLMNEADRNWGGFGRAPKFPQTFILRFLMEYHYIYKDNEALDQVTLSLNRMLEGGLYDQVGGGFARYSTDTEWRVPHFEKMLYDNALLVRLLADAYQLTGADRYRRAIMATCNWVRREMTSPEGGYYSALDADSEGVEGKYYLWTREELNEILNPSEVALLEKVYGIKPGGNWEGSNILYFEQPLADSLALSGLSEEELARQLASAHQKLLEVREGRVPPGLDDKIILSWNALYSTALSKAWAATGEESFRDEAIRHMQFMEKVFYDGSQYLHTYKNGESKYAAYLDDLASWIEALLLLQEITGDTKWLKKAESITQYVQEHFVEQGTGFFYFTQEGQNDVIIRKKEVYDGAIPSGNALMACNLYHLSFLLHKPEWRAQSKKMLEGLASPLLKYPSSFGLWGGLLLEQASGTREIAIVGPRAGKLAQELMNNYLPHKVLMYSEKENSEFPLLADKKMTDSAFIYNCRDFACEVPVRTVEEFLTSL